MDMASYMYSSEYNGTTWTGSNKLASCDYEIYKTEEFNNTTYVLFSVNERLVFGKYAGGVLTVISNISSGYIEGCDMTVGNEGLYLIYSENSVIKILKYNGTTISNVTSFNASGVVRTAITVSGTDVYFAYREFDYPSDTIKLYRVNTSGTITLVDDSLSNCEEIILRSYNSKIYIGTNSTNNNKGVRTYVYDCNTDTLSKLGEDITNNAVMIADVIVQNENIYFAIADQGTGTTNVYTYKSGNWVIVGESVLSHAMETIEIFKAGNRLIVVGQYNNKPVVKYLDL